MTTPLSAHDEEMLRTITEAQVLTIPERNWAAWVDVCTEDVVLLPVNEDTVEGRDNVVAWLESLPHVAAVRATVDDIGGTDDVAFTRGTAPATLDLDGTVTEVCFNWLKVFRRQDDGTWKIVTDLVSVFGRGESAPHGPRRASSRRPALAVPPTGSTSASTRRR